LSQIKPAAKSDDTPPRRANAILYYFPAGAVRGSTDISPAIALLMFITSMIPLPAMQPGEAVYAPDPPAKRFA